MNWKPVIPVIVVFCLFCLVFCWGCFGLWLLLLSVCCFLLFFVLFVCAVRGMTAFGLASLNDLAKAMKALDGKKSTLHDTGDLHLWMSTELSQRAKTKEKERPRINRSQTTLELKERAK